MKKVFDCMLEFEIIFLVCLASRLSPILDVQYLRHLNLISNVLDHVFRSMTSLLCWNTWFVGLINQAAWVRHGKVSYA